MVLVSQHEVHGSLGGLEFSGTVTFERETWEDPGGTWVEDVEVEGFEFEELEASVREQIEEALVDAARGEQ